MCPGLVSSILLSTSSLNLGERLRLLMILMISSSALQWYFSGDSRVYLSGLQLISSGFCTVAFVIAVHVCLQVSVTVCVNSNLISGRSWMRMAYVCFAAARTSLRVCIKHAGRFFYFCAFWLIKYPSNTTIYRRKLRDGVGKKVFFVIFSSPAFSVGLQLRKSFPYRLYFLVLRRSDLVDLAIVLGGRCIVYLFCCFSVVVPKLGDQKIAGIVFRIGGIWEV